MEELVAFNVKLPPPLIKRLRVRAAEEETTIQRLVAMLLEAGLKRGGK